MSFEDFLQWNDIILKLNNLPSHMNGFAYYNGINYLVIINSKCSSIQQQKTLVHEMIHIFENHFSCPSGCEEQCEQEVQYFVKEMKSNYMIKHTDVFI